MNVEILNTECMLLGLCSCVMILRERVLSVTDRGHTELLRDTERANIVCSQNSPNYHCQNETTVTKRKIFGTLKQTLYLQRACYVVCLGNTQTQDCFWVAKNTLPHELIISARPQLHSATSRERETCMNVKTKMSCKVLQTRVGVAPHPVKAQSL